MFSTEVSADEDNIFSVNLSENNDVDQIKFDKSKLYTICGLSIDPKSRRVFCCQMLKEKKLSVTF